MLLVLSATGVSFAFQPIQNTRTVPLKSHSPLLYSTTAITSSSSDFDVSLEEDVVVYDDDVVANQLEVLGEEDSLVFDFVEMVEQTPVGALEYKEAALLREIMASTALDNSGGKDAPVVIERLLYRMIDEWGEVSDEAMEPLLKPTTQDFVLAMKTWEGAAAAIAQEGKGIRRNINVLLPTAVEHVWKLYVCMEDLWKRGVTSPSPQVFEILLRVLASSRERGVDRKCRGVFEDLQRKYSVVPTLDMYQSLIVALAKSRDRGAAHRAETFLREAVELFPTDISIDTFNVVLTAWAKSSEDYGPERAEKLILLMDELDHGGQRSLRPNVSSFTSLLDAYAQKLDWDSVSQAEQIFNRLLDQYLEGEADREPNIATWTIVLSAWAKLSRKKYKGAAKRADRLMTRLESLYKEGRISFGPDAIVYISIMNAWAFSKTPEGAARAQEILNEMFERYLDGNESMKPTAKSIRVVIESWMKSGLPDAMERAEQLLDNYEDFLDSLCEGKDNQQDDSSPSEDIPEEVADVYRTMLFGWTKNGDPEQAQEYLMDMVEKNMKLDPFCFDKIIEANTQVNDEKAMDRTQEVFALMEKCRRKGLVAPNERVYTSFIRAMIKARVPNMAHKSHVLLKYMQDLSQAEGNKYIQPQVFTYNAVLHACAETRFTEDPDPSEAFKIASK
jgi:uncharacterized tellurite resistance protein B-like protein